MTDQTQTIIDITTPNARLSSGHATVEARQRPGIYDGYWRELRSTTDCEAAAQSKGIAAYSADELANAIKAATRAARWSMWAAFAAALAALLSLILVGLR
ncbi:MAG: hypothetical protein WCA09_11215 [Burkholderiales bacterium]